MKVSHFNKIYDIARTSIDLYSDIYFNTAGYFWIDLTPKQMKTLITRAGPGTKVVCLGNIAQIDTPYLTETSSGLTYVVDRFKGWEHAGHITLQRGERSRLADFASDNL